MQYRKGWDTLKKSKLLIILALIGAILLPLIVQNRFLQSIFILILIYAVAGSAWNILGGYAGQISFGHCVFFTIGAYFPILLVIKFGMNPWLGVLGGIILSGILSALIGYPLFRLKSHYFAIATLALTQVVQAIVTGNSWLGGAVGLIAPITKEGFLQFQFHRSKIGYYYIILAFLIITLYVVYKLEKSYLGYYLKAIRDSEKASQSLGINVSLTKTIALIFSGCLTSIAGSFYGQYVMVLDPGVLINIDLGTIIALVAILGGVGKLWGPVIGAAVLIPLQELTRAYLSSSGRAYDLIIYSVLIIAVVLFEPNGILAIISNIKRKFLSKEKKYGDAISSSSN